MAPTHEGADTAMEGEIQPLQIPDVKLIRLSRFFDERGFFSEVYNRERLRALGIDADFVQDNHSHSKPRGVVRGLHFQTDPHSQAKLVRVSRGAIFDVVLDIRSGSPTYGRHVSLVMSARDWSQLWVPIGFAHGFCTLEPDTEVLYKTTGYYAEECSRGVRWDDPSLGIAWPASADDAIVSEADRRNPFLAELSAPFQFRDATAQNMD